MNNRITNKSNPKLKEERDYLITMIGAAIGFAAVLIVMSFSEKGSVPYYRSHNALFLIVLLSSIAFVVSGPNNARMYSTILKLITGDVRFNRQAVADLFWLSVILMTLYSFFVIDLSFFREYGFRISAVLSVIFMNIFVALFRLWRDKRRNQDKGFIETK